MRLSGQPSRLWVCAACQKQQQRWRRLIPSTTFVLRSSFIGRALHHDAAANHAASPAVPFRKQLKDEARQKRQAGAVRSGAQHQEVASSEWELTIGLEIHAQLDTARKLFSRARTAGIDEPPPNALVARFDAALPGSQPIFEAATLLPALRAALALNCTVQPRSSFDRKHYFYADQPAGYQLTQYYAPLARDGHLRLDRHDGLPAADGDAVVVGIRQVQLEQDTAKTLRQPPDTALLDFNRVGHPLIEIITQPQLHSPQAAAACVRKVQQLLQAVGAVATGMERGGLRADVNVSVRRRGARTLGTRTEIKNLSSFKAIEDAIVAERNRQIAVLAGGGLVAGETRAWTLGGHETRKLRGKEGEIDYRYMPDPDLPPVLVGAGLIEHVRHSLPMLPDAQTDFLITQYGLTRKDAKTLVALDGGERLDYFRAVLASVAERRGGVLTAMHETGKLASNWTLHELGGLLTRAESDFTPRLVPAPSLAAILHHLAAASISGPTAKSLLQRIFDGEDLDVDTIIDVESLRIRQLSDAEYQAMAEEVVAQHPDVVQKVRGGQHGKLQWLVGQMIRRSGGRVDAQRAAAALTQVVQPPQA